VSGFAGVVSLDGAPPDEILLNRMAERLAFRGPDGTHIWKQLGAGFCFTFLRTGPAPQCPSQPCSLDGNVWLLGDVRLDGRDDLRLKLEQHGEELAIDVTDEELVLRVWRRWGEQGLPELLGDYAFALWDAEARQLWCVRDLMGARPFFYARVGGQFHFSNTLNALRCSSNISSELDLQFIGDFLLQGSCSDLERSGFREVSRLRAAHVVRFSENGLDISRFTSIPIEEPLWLRHEEDYIERFTALLNDAVSDRLPQAPVAVSMSGGLDSTTIAAVAAQAVTTLGRSRSLAAYTIDYQPLFEDQEGRLAATMAKHLRIPINIRSAAFILPFEGSGKAQRLTPEPCSEPYWSLSSQQSYQAAQTARVMLTGYGGDGILTGQAWPYLRQLASRLKIGRIFSDFGRYVLRHRRLPSMRGGFRHKLTRWVRPLDPMIGYPQWLNDAYESEFHLRDRWRELQAPKHGIHPWYPDAHETLTRGFWESFLEGEDPAWSGVAIESRCPLLDARITRFLLGVPPVPLCVDKELLRRATRHLLPEEIRLRPKTPLRRDQLALQLRRGLWSPFPLPAPDRNIENMIDWHKLDSTLRLNSIAFPWADLRPVSLLYWLQGIENVSDNRQCSKETVTV
jgi:asparagine synthase (glutamine-hydrolysing)